MQKLKITVPQDGSGPKIDVIQGPGGEGGLDLLKPLVDGLGSEVEYEDKDAMFETEDETVDEGGY